MSSSLETDAPSAMHLPRDHVLSMEKELDCLVMLPWLVLIMLQAKVVLWAGNPAAYTCMAVEFNLQTVASLINYRKGNALGRFAGGQPASRPIETFGAVHCKSK